MAVAAFSFVSCDCKKANTAECEKACACEECKCDPCECEEGGACKCDPCECEECKCAEGCEKACEKECGECPMKALEEKLEAGDAEGITAALADVQAKIEALVADGKTEAAQKLGGAVKEFIETNKEKLDAAAVKVDDVVTAISNLPAAAVDAATDAADAAVDAAKDAADAAVEAGKDAVEAGKAKAGEQIDKAADAAKKKLGL